MFVLRLLSNKRINKKALDISKKIIKGMSNSNNKTPEFANKILSDNNLKEISMHTLEELPRDTFEAVKKMGGTAVAESLYKKGTKIYLDFDSPYFLMNSAHEITHGIQDKYKKILFTPNERLYRKVYAKPYQEAYYIFNEILDESVKSISTKEGFLEAFNKAKENNDFNGSAKKLKKFIKLIADKEYNAYKNGDEMIDTKSPNKYTTMSKLMLDFIS